MRVEILLIICDLCLNVIPGSEIYSFELHYNDYDKGNECKKDQ